MMSDFEREPGEQLATAAYAEGYAIREVARRCETSTGQILRVFNPDYSRHVKLSSLHKVAEAIGCRIEVRVVPKEPCPCCGRFMPPVLTEDEECVRCGGTGIVNYGGNRTFQPCPDCTTVEGGDDDES